MHVDFTRAIRTPYSERFLLHLKPGEDSAALDLHYLRDGTVSGTLILFQAENMPETAIADLLKSVDEKLLPEVSFDGRNLSFTVVVGRVVGSFVPDRTHA